MALFMSDQPNLKYVKMKMIPLALLSHQKLISVKWIKLAQAALRAPPVALQCVAGHCYYHRSVSLSFGPCGFACATQDGVCNA